MLTSDVSLCDQETIDRLAGLMTHGNPDETLEALQAALEIHPHDARLHLLRGSLYASEGDEARARDDLRQATLLDPYLEEARFMLGFLEYSQGRVTEARVIWMPLATVAGDTAIRSLATGVLQVLDGDTNAARETLHRALSLGPSAAISTYIHGVLREIENTAPAADSEEESAPAAHFLLSDYVSNQTRH